MTYKDSKDLSEYIAQHQIQDMPIQHKRVRISVSKPQDKQKIAESIICGAVRYIGNKFSDVLKDAINSGVEDSAVTTLYIHGRIDPKLKNSMSIISAIDPEDIPRNLRRQYGFSNKVIEIITRAGHII